MIEKTTDGRKVLGVTWYTSQANTIGIVALDNGFEEKAYIGVGLFGNEDLDIEHIAAYGAHFPIKQAKEIIGWE